ncbi:sodium ABC transporter ATP-binding protein [Loigolactobacillus backii]|uniref:ABC transporter ATP-binding protein n=1 Tax=Loigolactobacillus backii TaxID=375175 RepID=UPI000C1CAF79|nr:ABC transporter ATP-binding protein [Loigolactobacillus backii]PIO82505.1 sodium ABC transporter ATP-binding protein [Loigolactobacillus backii]
MLEVTNLSKSFGSAQVLKQVSFKAQDGQILGLIGQNGAGKSTTFHSILNFIQFTGTISWNGQALTEKDYNIIGYLPEERSLMPKLTVQQQIRYLARLKGYQTSDIDRQIPKWLERFAVKGDKKDKIKSLSKGNQQKIQLICTLLHQPKLIILDEPFSGLDPVNADLLKQAILEAKQAGATIIFSDHDMSNVEDLCDQVLMLKQGKVVLTGDLQAVREQFGRNRLFVKTDWSTERLAALPHVIQVALTRAGTYRLTLDTESAGPEIFTALTQGHYIQTFDQQPPTLDEIFRMKAGATDD